MSDPTPGLRSRIALTIVCALLLAVGAAACSGPESDASDPSKGGGGGGGGGAGCPELDALAGPDDDHEPPADAATVILVDRSESTLGRRSEVETALEATIASVTADQARLVIGTFGASRSSAGPLPCLEDLVLYPAGNNGPVRESNTEKIPGQVAEAAFAALSDESAEGEGTDPAAALSAAADELVRIAGEGTGRAILLTDWAATTGCLHPANDEPTPVADLVAGCDDLPDLDGVDVIIAGVGRSEPRPTTEQVEWWMDLATATCEATGADCTITGSHIPPLEEG